MTKPKLFLLKPDFIDRNIDNQTKFFCPHSAMINGIIAYYPKLKELMEIVYIDFERPRKLLVELVGEENQGCPNLVIHKEEIDENADVSYFDSFGEYLFVNSDTLIVKYLSEKYGIGESHE